MSEIKEDSLNKESEREIISQIIDILQKYNVTFGQVPELIKNLNLCLDHVSSSTLIRRK